MKKIVTIITIIAAVVAFTLALTSCSPTLPNYETTYYYYYRGAWHPYHTYQEHRVYVPRIQPQRIFHPRR